MNFQGSSYANQRGRVAVRRANIKFCTYILTCSLDLYKYLKTKVMLLSTPIRLKKGYHCSVSVTILS